MTTEKSGAIISPCESHRYSLWRIWDTEKPLVLWVMHNPSTADGIQDDPTIRRIINFSKDWGFGGIYVGNLFSYRATNPKELMNKPFEEICPSENFGHLEEMFVKCSLHILAFGNPIGKYKGRVIGNSNWYALKLTKSGNPCHPLYLKSDLKPFAIESCTV